MLQQIVARALAPDPQERYDSAEAMVADLRLVERELSGGRPAPEAPIRSPRRAWIAGGLAALTALVIGWVARCPHRHGSTRAGSSWPISETRPGTPRLLRSARWRAT